MLNVFNFLQLPDELVHTILGHLASASELNELLRLRNVSKRFDKHIMDRSVFPRAASYRDIVKCNNKDIILKYLRWYQQLEALSSGEVGCDPEKRIVSGVMAMLKSFADAFVSLSAGKHTFESTLEIVHSLFADQLIARRLQPHNISPVWFGRRLEGPFLWWYSYNSAAGIWNGPSIPQLAVSPQSACMVIACAMGDRNSLLLSLDRCALAHSEFHDTETSGMATHEKLLNYDLVLGHPISSAIREGQHEMMDYLLARDCNLKFPRLWSVLKDAVIARRYDMLRLLLRQDCEPGYWKTHSTGYPETGDAITDALALACRYNDEAAFDIILQSVEQPLERHVLEYMLFSSCEGGAEDTARHILKIWPSLDSNFDLPCSFSSFKIRLATRSRHTITEAAAHGHPGLIKLLLEHGAVYPPVVHAKERTPMENAAKFGHANCLRLLLNLTSAEPLEELEDALREAIDGPNPVCRELLKDHGVKLTG